MNMYIDIYASTGHFKRMWLHCEYIYKCKYIEIQICIRINPFLHMHIYVCIYIILSMYINLNV
jgi:hypothetical protein